MNKHTKGPWIVKRIGLGQEDEKFLILPENFISATDWIVLCHKTNENSEANSNLIAAAPDMHTALDRVVERLIVHGSVTEKEMKLMTDALIKADGNERKE